MVSGSSMPNSCNDLYTYINGRQIVSKKIGSIKRDRKRRKKCMIFVNVRREIKKIVL